MQRWCQVVIVGPVGEPVVRCDLRGHGAPDLRAVDDVAQFALLARRLGRALVLCQVDPGLRELLELTGLRVEVQREPELGEEPLGVEE
jgi:hypothetical protein